MIDIRSHFRGLLPTLKGTNLCNEILNKISWIENAKQLKKSLQMSQGGSIVIPKKNNNYATLIQKFTVSQTPIITYQL